MNVYVGNLPYTATEEELQSTFEQFGNVNSASIIKDKHSGRSKGFGFIEMPSDDEAQSAIEGLNNKPFHGRNLIVNKARPQVAREGRSGGGGGGSRSGGFRSGGFRSRD